MPCGWCEYCPFSVQAECEDKKKMKNYLSFGGGVNSVALYLLMENLGMEFEAVFVNHGGDWPETYDYLQYFLATGRPVTVLEPEVNTVEKIIFNNLPAYCEHKAILPNRTNRWCTDRFKVRVVEAYIETPCFMHLGIDAGESHRARLSPVAGRENRFLLIEHGIDRDGCKRLIADVGLDLPPKSGCWFCPYQGKAEFRLLRKKHPALFCRAQKLEEARNNRPEAQSGQWKPYYLCDIPLADVIAGVDKQQGLPGMDADYPPCHCGL